MALPSRLPHECSHLRSGRLPKLHGEPDAGASPSRARVACRGGLALSDEATAMSQDEISQGYRTERTKNCKASGWNGSLGSKVTKNVPKSKILRCVGERLREALQHLRLNTFCIMAWVFEHSGR